MAQVRQDGSGLPGARASVSSFLQRPSEAVSNDSLSRVFRILAVRSCGRTYGSNKRTVESAER